VLLRVRLIAERILSPEEFDSVTVMRSIGL
jgi:hypothetical protein